MTHSFAVSDIECPVCGTLMEAAVWDAFWWFLCPKCGHQSPAKSDPSEARDAAMRRERPKGEWIEAQEYLFDSVYTCSACGSVFVLESGTPKDNEYNFCPFCGADMREEKEDER